MIQPQRLLADLQALLPKLEQDILAYSQTQPELEAHLKAEYARATEAKRTAEHFVAWREAQITQAAAAWVLTCVFVRFLEDNRLLEMPMLSGPAAESGQGALQQAKDRMTVYFSEHPTQAERDYLLAVFAELETLPALAELLDRAHNPLWRLPLSADGAKALIDFFQRLDPETGAIVHDFTDDRAEGGWDTRFLGDLYQDLSESVRKRYALLQTPEFVERFILDYTLEPALSAFGLPGLKLIDPTCGSGHFLLTGFERLFNAWQQREPATNARALAQRALDAIHGVDINPYAVAIARFRLLIAAMKAAGSHRLKDAPDFHFNLAVGDSLLLGPRHESQGQALQTHLLDDPLAHCFEVEDKTKLERILGQRYQVVVGNPPYPPVKDKALNKAYRVRYPTCHRKYSLGVPFTERFFDLALPAENIRSAGFVGMITANSFMKREFGKKLIEDYLPLKDLTHVIDTSGAYIPGHGTPTVILFGRNRRPETDQLRAVLGIRGEPSTPDDAAQGLVWRSIVELLERPGSESAFVSVVDQERGLYARHPWSVGGGGASELKALLESGAAGNLGNLAELIGVFGMTNADEIMLGAKSEFLRSGVEPELIKTIYLGDAIRDWAATDTDQVLFPYDHTRQLVQAKDFQGFYRWMWIGRSVLGNRATFNKGTYFSECRPWWEWHQVTMDRLLTPLSITFAEVASHNHFVLDRGGKVFKQTAPIIKLPARATEDGHLALLGLLNSSTACFWMKQVSHQKQMTGGDGVRVADRSKVPYQFSGTALGKMPIPKLFEAPEIKSRINLLAAKADESGRRISALSAAEVLRKAISENSDLRRTWKSTLHSKKTLRSQLIIIQEEIDWTLYYVYGLCGPELMADVEGWADACIEAGQRPFEIVASLNQDGFDVPPDVPVDWPQEMQSKWRQRMEAIKANRSIRIIEDPHYKRRWIGRQGLFNHAARSDELRNACRDWLLDHLETLCHAPELLTVAQLAERSHHDAAFQQVAALYTGSDTFDARALVAELVEAEQVPQMAAARVKSKAMPKFRAWQETWDQQRAEDAIDARTQLDPADPASLTEDAAKALKAREIGAIPLPPKNTPPPTFASRATGACAASSMCPRSASSACPAASAQATAPWSSAGPGSIICSAPRPSPPGPWSARSKTAGTPRSSNRCWSRSTS